MAKQRKAITALQDEALLYRTISIDVIGSDEVASVSTSRIRNVSPKKVNRIQLLLVPL